MKKVFLVILTILCIFLGSCSRGAKGGVIRVRIFCESASERDEIIEKVTSVVKGATSAEECKELLSKQGYSLGEEYYESTWCDGRYFAAGNYLTFRVGEGKKGWQYIAYPSYVYQSLEEYDNAGYSSFFYEIVKKAEERNKNEKS